MKSELPPEWSETTWGEIAGLVYGKALRERSDDGSVTVYGTNGPAGRTDRTLGEGPTVVIGRKGAYRGVHYAQGPFWVIDTAFFLVPAVDVDIAWAYYELLTHDINGLDSGSAIPSTRRDDFYAMPVRVPPLAEQKRIVSVLRMLDDKIDSNRRLAALLEETAAAVFRARFVDFVSIEKFTKSEIGPIPRGWRAIPFSDAVEINPTVPLRKGEVAPFIEMAAVPPWGLRPSNITERQYSGGARFQPGDTLMARITGCIEHGKGAFIDFLKGPGSGSTEFLVFRAKPPLTPEAVFLLSRDNRVRSHAIANMTGSSGRQRVAKECFDDLKIAVPPDVDSWRIDAEFLRAALAQSRGLWRESRSLADIRNALLPKLISGAIRVPDTADPDEAIGAVTEKVAT